MKKQSIIKKSSAGIRTQLPDPRKRKALGIVTQLPDPKKQKKQKKAAQEG